jgi:hypothetical protein
MKDDEDDMGGVGNGWLILLVGGTEFGGWAMFKLNVGLWLDRSQEKVVLFGRRGVKPSRSMDRWSTDV